MEKIEFYKKIDKKTVLLLLVSGLSLNLQLEKRKDYNNEKRYSPGEL